MHPGFTSSLNPEYWALEYHALILCGDLLLKGNHDEIKVYTFSPWLLQNNPPFFKVPYYPEGPYNGIRP